MQCVPPRLGHKRYHAFLCSFWRTCARESQLPCHKDRDPCGEGLRLPSNKHARETQCRDSNPGEHSDDGDTGQQLDYNLVKHRARATSSAALDSNPQNLLEIIKVYCYFKPLRFWNNLLCSKQQLTRYIQSSLVFIPVSSMALKVADFLLVSLSFHCFSF